MRRRSTTSAVVLAALVAAGAAPGATGAGPRTHRATVEGGFYTPAKLTVRAGDRVRWTWDTNGFDLHDVNVEAGPERFRSPSQAAGTYTRTFKKPGTFRLYCTQHGDMTQTLVVKKAKRRRR